MMTEDPQTPLHSIYDPKCVTPPPITSTTTNVLMPGFGDSSSVRSGRSTGTSASTVKHPSELDEVELRVQLWDAYRLARIILGNSIRSRSLKSRTIIHAIRIVAEMKLEVIRLHKEIETYQALAKESAELLEEQMQEQRAALEKQQRKLQQQQYHCPQWQTVLDKINALEMDPATASQLQEILRQYNPDDPTTTPSDDKKQIEKLKRKLQKKEDELAQAQHFIQELKSKFKTRQTVHMLELESHKTKHFQQVADMSGQLELYREQVQVQQDELMEWNAKYNALESVAVTHEQAKEVLDMVENVDSETSEEIQDLVNTNVVSILRRLVDLYNHRQGENKALQDTLDSAKQRESESEEEVRHLNLQLQILEEETKMPASEYQKKIRSRRKEYKQQIAKIMKEEERRLMEMELLEVQLTELAFEAVHIEDLQKELKEMDETQEPHLQSEQTRQQALALQVQGIQALQKKLNELKNEQKDSLDKLRAIGVLTENANIMNGDDYRFQHALAQALQALQARIKELKDEQKDSLDKLHASGQQLMENGDTISDDDYQLALASKENELQQTQEFWHQSRQRIKELENEIEQHPGAAIVSS